MDKKPKRHHSIETTVLPDGHAALFSKKSHWAFTLTPLAALVWEFCDGTNSLDEIVDNIKKIPEVQFGTTVDEEIKSLVKELDSAGFFED